MSEIKVSVTFRHTQPTEALKQYAGQKVRRVGMLVNGVDTDPANIFLNRWMPTSPWRWTPKNAKWRRSSCTRTAR